MTKEIKVSIIIPVYSTEDYIEDCLESAFNQTYKSIEYIIVDDGSPDSSMKIAHKTIQKYKKEKEIKIIRHTENKGLSAARNSGMKESSGDYLYFLDSDDLITAECIEYLVSFINEPTVDIVIGSFAIFSNNIKKEEIPYIEKTTMFHNEEILNSFVEKKWSETVWNKLIRRQICFEKDLFFPEGLIHEDIYWSFIVAANTQNIILCKRHTYHYRKRSHSITQNKDKKNFDSLSTIITDIIAYSIKKDLLKEYPKLIAYIINLAYYLYKEIIKANIEVTYILNIRRKIRFSFNNIPIKYRKNIPLYSQLQFAVYKTPIFISNIFFQLLLTFQKK